jgi:hypothetical protein
VYEKAKLLELLDVMRELGPATPMLANSTVDEIAPSKAIIETHLSKV